ncbi:MAG: ABC transporter substrate-binding protein [Ramlibacter sp.]|nr:ABC transporter substrate-binding protein [Ramlibacter sp.]
MAGGAAALAPLTCAFAPDAFAQGAKAVTASRGITVTQLFDTSATQQDVSKDFLIGSRAAWQDINLKGGLHGRPVQHTSIEVDGSAASVRAAIVQVRDNPSCVVLSGTAGDIAAGQVAAALKQEQLSIAHVAPWLQNSSTDIDDRTFPIFAARQEQIAHALKSLTVMSVQEIGAVYASDVELNAYQQDLERTASELKIKLQTFRSGGDLVRLGQRLTQTTPAILLFVGGTPELAQFTQGLEKQSRQRYVVALADVNLQTLMQMGAARNTPVIATQAVPLVTSSLPVVRSYRDVLAKLFDEPPTPHSLSGFIAARYTYEVLREADANLTRQSALAAFQRRANLDVGGFRVTFDQRRRAGTFVTQSMLTLDGRVIG